MDSPIPLAQCKFCKTRRRVLPVEILPYKTYGLPVIEAACRHYTKATDGLRNTVKKIPGVAPHYSTLHGWIGGMGEKALDRVQLQNQRAKIGKPALPPTSALISETAKIKDPDLISNWNKIDPYIPSWKYKSSFRKEMITSCFKLLHIAFLLFQNSVYPFTQWEAFLRPVFNVPCFLFSSRNIISAIQLSDFINNLVLYEQAEKREPP